MPKILYLLDGHAIAYRAYFALTSGGSTRWATSSGEPTAGVYGFASMLLKLLEQEDPDYLAVSFDTGKTFRHEMFPEYKGTRAKMPDDLRAQIERIREMVDCLIFPASRSKITRRMTSSAASRPGQPPKKGWVSKSSPATAICCSL